MASQRHKLAVHNYGATCYAIDEKQPAIGYMRQIPGPYVQPTGAIGGPLKGSTLAGPPPAAIPAPSIDNPLVVLGLILAGSQLPPDAEVERRPAVGALNPGEATIGGADVTLHVTGVNFYDTSVVVFNGGVETTTFVSSNELTTIVRPSTAVTPGSYPVLVRNDDGRESNAVNFTFIEDTTVAAVMRKPKKKGS